MSMAVHVDSRTTFWASLPSWDHHACVGFIKTCLEKAGEIVKIVGKSRTKQKKKKKTFTPSKSTPPW